MEILKAFQTRLLTLCTCVSLLALVFMGWGVRSQAQDPPGWTLVWSDEFSQPDGSSPDSSKWEFQIGDGCSIGLCGWGNAELEYYTSRTNNARIEGGQLIIETHAESFGGKNYTSSRLRTKYNGDWTYGRFEARMKLPYGQGIWPAFWMLPTESPYGGWAASGEIDIMELVGHVPNQVHGTIHYHGEWPNNWSSGGSYTLPSGDFSDAFHVFALEWEVGAMRWYVDGINYSTKTSWDTTSGAPFPAPFDVPFHILLNLAVGGNWPGYPDGSTVFPQQLVVDYVRVYSATNSPPVPPSPGTNALVNPGFETSALPPWVGYSLGGANALGTYIESTNNTYYNGGNSGGDHVLTHSGDYVGKIYGDFTGGENFNGCYQDIPAEPDSHWNADGWALTHAQDLMQTPNTTWIEVLFRNDSNVILGLYRSDILTAGNVSVSSWMHLPVTNQLDPSSLVITNTGPTLIAPAGTTKARYQLVFHQQGNDDGAMYYDDLNLVLQPVALPVTLSAAFDGSNIQISFPTQNGVSYDVAYKNSLMDSDWTPLETIVGDGTTITVSYPADSPIRYYTIKAP